MASFAFPRWWQKLRPNPNINENFHHENEGGLRQISPASQRPHNDPLRKQAKLGKLGGQYYFARGQQFRNEKMEDTILLDVKTRTLSSPKAESEVRFLEAEKKREQEVLAAGKKYNFPKQDPANGFVVDFSGDQYMQVDIAPFNKPTPFQFDPAPRGFRLAPKGVEMNVARPLHLGNPKGK